MDFRDYKGEVLEAPPRKRRPKPSVYELVLIVWLALIAAVGIGILKYGPAILMGFFRFNN